MPTGDRRRAMGVDARRIRQNRLARRLRLGSGAGAVARLAGGSAVAQGILILVTPVLTRIYAPAEFGVLAAFMSLAAWASIAATGRYEEAIILPAENQKAVALAVLSLVLAFGSSVLACLAVLGVLIARDWEPELLWTLWLPPMILLTSGSAVLISYATRHERYSRIASANVVKSLATGVLQLGFGVISPTGGALSGGAALGAASGNLPLARELVRDYRRQAPTWARLRASAKEFRRFPIHTLPAGMLSAGTLQMLPIFIGITFGAAILGIWSMANRLLLIPLWLISQSVAQVFARRAAELRITGGDCLALIRSTAARLALLSFGPFLLFAVFAPWIFSFVFGPEWRDAGTYARIMVPWLWVRFVTSPLGQTPVVFGRNDIGLAVQATLFAATAVVCGIAVALGWQFTTFLTVLSGASAVCYASFYFVYSGLARRG